MPLRLRQPPAPRRRVGPVGRARHRQHHLRRARPGRHRRGPLRADRRPADGRASSFDAGRGERVGRCRSDWSCRRATSTSSRAGSRAAPGHASSSSPRPPSASGSSRSGPASTSCPSGRASRSPSTAGRCRPGLAPLVPRVGIGLIVMNSTFHNPAMTAKAAATLDAISGGRLTLGLGAGFKDNEARAFGYDYPPLKERMEMAVRALRDHLAGDPPGRAGASRSRATYARVEDLANSPRSRAQPGDQAADRRARQELHVPPRRALLRRAEPQHLPRRGPGAARGLPRALRRDRARPGDRRAQLRAPTRSCATRASR